MERLPKAGSEHKLFGRINPVECAKNYEIIFGSVYETG